MRTSYAVLALQNHLPQTNRALTPYYLAQAGLCPETRQPARGCLQSGPCSAPVGIAQSGSHLL